jgi:tetratricopeptide (TPR) repeat protein/cellulose biosynthesis protein BcsQ
MTPNSTDKPGKVITFYSYKGGTGRSMALANVACLLAQRSTHSRGVLMMDWDLEAPGLHRFFRDRFTQRFGDGETSEPRMNTAPGLIDLFFDLATATASTAPNAQSEDDAYALMETFDIDKYIIQTDVPSLSLLKAGAFTEHYSQRVTTFNWEALYTRSPFLMQALAERLTRDYSYVLVDSRTGISDVAGVCTMLLPEKLVVVFTPNRQSLLGLHDLIRRATEYRSQSDDLRPLIVLPLPSRIDLSEKDLQQWWRSSDKIEVVAYQPLFEQLFKEVYELRTCDLSTYFDEVRIQHFPFYSYGEKIAVLQAGESDRLSLARSYETFTTWLADRQFPWKEDVPASSRPEIGTVTDDVKAAESALARLSPDEQRTLQRVVLRIVRVPEPNEQSRLNTSLQAKLADFDPSARQLIGTLRDTRMFVVEKNEKGEEIVRFANDGLVNSWGRLTTWVKEDYDLLLQRQQLRANISQWEKSNKDQTTLLSDALLKDAKVLATNRRANLNADEENFIRESEFAEERKKTRNRTIAAVLIILAFSALVIALFQNFSSRRQDEFKTLISEGYRLSNDSSDAAIGLFNKAIAVHEDNADAYFGRGIVYGAQKNYAAAISNFDTVILKQPANARAYHDRGFAHLSTNDTAKAMEDFTRAIMLDSNFALAYTNRGHTLFTLGDTSRAILDFDRALSLDSASAIAFNNRAYVFFRQGNLSEARRLYDRAILLDSTALLAINGRGAVRLAMGDTISALADYSLAIRLKPKPYAYFQRAQVYYASGAFKSAVSDNTTAIELDPNYAEAYYYRSLAYDNLRNSQAAINDMRKVVTIASDSTLLANARSYLQKWGAEQTSPLPPNVSARIFVYYNDVNDSVAVRRLRERIAEEKVTVGRVQLRSERTFGEIRFYFASDKKMAERIRSIAQRELAGELGIKIELQMNFLGAFFEQNVRPNLANRMSAPGTIEVWLPSLQTYLRSRQMGK